MTGGFRVQFATAPADHREKTDHVKPLDLPSDWQLSDPPASTLPLHERVAGVKMLVLEAARNDLAMLQVLTTAIQKVAAAAEAKGLRASPILAPANPDRVPRYSHARCTAHWRIIMQRLSASLTPETSSNDALLHQIDGIPALLPWNGDTALRLSQSILQAVRQEAPQSDTGDERDLLDSVMDDLTVRLPFFRRRDYQGTVEFVNAPIRASIEILRRLEHAVSEVDGSTAPRRYTRRLTRLIHRVSQLVLSE